MIAPNISSIDSTPLDCPEMFKRYIKRSVRAALSRLMKDGFSFSDEVRGRALHVLSFALQLNDAWQDTYELLLCMTPKMEKAGYRDEWIPYLETGLQRGKTLEDKAAVAELNLQLGFLYQLRSKLTKAYHCYQTSAICFELDGDRYNQARALNQQAFVARLQRQHPEAIRLTDIALQLLPLGDVRRATSYVVRGWVAIDRYEFAVAEAYFVQALDLWKEQGDQRQIARRLRDLADALQLQKRYQESSDYYEQAIQLFAAIQDRFELAVTQMNLGVIYLLQQQTEKALDCFTSVESEFRQLQDHWNLADTYTNQGIAYRNLRQYTRATAVLHKSIELFDSQNRIDRLINAMDELGITYLEEEKVNESVDVFQQALMRLQPLEKEPGYIQQQKRISTHLQAALNKPR